MALRLLGVDPGVANCGYAGALAIPGEKKLIPMTYQGVWSTPKDWDDRRRMDYLGGQLADTLLCMKPDYVGIEGWTFMGGRGKQESQMPALIEHLYMTCKNLGVKAYIYENKEWKKKTLGIHGANKKQVEHYVKRHLTDSANKRLPSHVWDSLGICLAVLKDIEE